MGWYCLVTFSIQHPPRFHLPVIPRVPPPSWSNWVSLVHCGHVLGMFAESGGCTIGCGTSKQRQSPFAAEFRLKKLLCQWTGRLPRKKATKPVKQMAPTSWTAQGVSYKKYGRLAVWQELCYQIWRGLPLWRVQPFCVMRDATTSNHLTVRQDSQHVQQMTT